MKTFAVSKPINVAKLTAELVAAGVPGPMGGPPGVRDFGGITGEVVTDDAAVDERVLAVIAAHVAIPRPPRTPRTLASIKTDLTPSIVARLTPPAKAWASTQDDAFVHTLDGVSLVAVWLQAAPNGAQLKGINIRGDK